MGTKTKGVKLTKSRNKGSRRITQLLTYKKKQQQYFRHEQTIIPPQIVYFERKKFSKYISTDIAQVLLYIDEQKSQHFM